MQRSIVVMAARVVLGTTTARADGPPPSPMEPQRGSLYSGQSVRVDDGTCPVGKIKKITEGNMTSDARIRTCVARH